MRHDRTHGIGRSRPETRVFSVPPCLRGESSSTSMIVRLLRIAWSNLWRNPRRTAITVSGLALGVIMLAFSDSLMAGICRDLIEQGTRLLLGHVQIHARNYRPDRSIFDTIPGD